MKRSILVPLLLALLLPSVPAFAGGGPETTLVVVNKDSPLSRDVANEYIALRHIPQSHVVNLTGIPTLGVVDVDFFKTKIWAPIEAAMKARGIEDSVDLITYSADFPYAVNFRKLLPGRPGMQIGGEASLTGVTYLARHVMAGDTFWNLSINKYFRLDLNAGGASHRMRGTRAEAQAYQEAMQALAAKDYARAAAAFGRLVTTFRDNDNVWYNYACCLARTGKKEKALDALKMAAETGFGEAAHAKHDPDLASIRKDPRFQKILGEMHGRPIPAFPAHGFRSTDAWSLSSDPTPDGTGPDRYWLSTCLAYTGHDGNSLPEIMAYLKSAAASDGTSPDGTVYICKNGNVRSTARQQFFPSLVAGLTKLGHKVEILERGKDGQNGIIPENKDDVIGAVVGAAGFNWGKSKSRFLPGAIAEHLTSFGAHFGTKSQTKLTEFLRYGAAGSSGTVMEPLAIWMKFPVPEIHVFYAEGSDLAEAFYESTFGPYQLLVVGDGLARPYAVFTDVKVDAPPSPWKGTVTLRPKADAQSFELFVDGRRLASGSTLTLDTTKLTDGWHDVRVVAIGKEPVKTRSFKELAVTVANKTAGKDAEYEGAPVVAFRDSVRIHALGTRKMEILCQGRVVAEHEGSSVEVPASEVGPGPVTLVPRLTLADGGTFISKPIRIRVDFPRELEGRKEKGATSPGILAEIVTKGAKTDYVIDNLGDRWGGKPMRDVLPAKKGDRIEFSGEMEAPKEGFFRLLVTGHGTFSLTIDRKTLVKKKPLDGALWLPVSLKTGWHPVRMELVPAGRPDLEMELTGAAVTTIPKFRHEGSAKKALKAEKAAKTAVKDGAIVLEWKRTVRDLGGVRIVAPNGAKGFPTSWVVEVRTSYSRWRKVRDPVALIQPGKKGPRSIEISFERARARELRVRPQSGTPPSGTKVEALKHP